MTEKNQEWKKVSNFGNGEIFSRGNERKLVTPNMEDIKYRVEPIKIKPIEPSKEK